MFFEPGRPVMAHVFEGKLYFTRDYMQGKFVHKNLKLREPKPASKPRAKASSKASSSGEHVQLFRIVPHVILSQGGFPSRTFVGFSCFIACENMGVNLKFQVTNTCVCMPLGMWVEVKGHSYHALTHVCVGSCMCCV